MIPGPPASAPSRWACDLMTDSPTQVDFEQLRELYVQSTWKEKKPEASAESPGMPD